MDLNSESSGIATALKDALEPLAKPHLDAACESQLRIVMSGKTVGTEVFLGGRKVDHLVDVAVCHKVGEVPVVHLTILALDGVEIAGEASVVTEQIKPGEDVTSHGREFREFRPT